MEGDGLTPTKLHCIAANKDGKVVSTSNYNNMRKFFLNSKVLVGHNIVLFDIPVVERLLGIKVEAELIDTLALSWYLEPTRVRHGLEFWGEELGIAKPEIDDWEGLSPEEYAHRCKTDVEINTLLWKRFWKHLMLIYGDEDKSMELVRYLTFKMKCAALQEKCKWKLDNMLCQDSMDKLLLIKQEKTDELFLAMPKVPKYSDKKYPAKPFKMDGSLSAHGKAWLEFLKGQGLPEDHKEPVKYVHSYEEPNPGSIPQLKDWLFSLGWEPMTYKHKRNKETGDVKKIPQINKDDKDNPGLCESVKELYTKVPALEALDGMFVVSHRISILKGFLENVDEDGYIQAKIQGFTNTLRFKHKIAVNLPGVDKPYGDIVRGCLVAPDGYELVGSDMSSLEDRCKQHYMWAYDPEYVKTQMAPDFDPHIDLAVFAGKMTEEQAIAYKAGDKQYKPLRHQFKTTNYAATYGAGGATVARAAGVSKSEGDALVEAYWKRNWAVRAVAENCTVKTVRGQKWLYNPVSKFWYSLRQEKDRFSTLNQGTGVFCFDTWIKCVLNKREQLTGQFHDEIVLCVKKGLRDKTIRLLKGCIKEANEILNLNRQLGVDIQFGDTYADIH